MQCILCILSGGNVDTAKIEIHSIDMQPVTARYGATEMARKKKAVHVMYSSSYKHVYAIHSSGLRSWYWVWFMNFHAVTVGSHAWIWRRITHLSNDLVNFDFIFWFCLAFSSIIVANVLYINGYIRNDMGRFSCNDKNSVHEYDPMHGWSSKLNYILCEHYKSIYANRCRYGNCAHKQ